MRQQLTGLLAVLAAVLMVVTLAAPAQASKASTLQDGIRHRTNAVRAEADLVKLRKKRCVTRFAVRQARRMANQDSMFHQDLQKVLEACDLTLAGENVASGFTTADAVMKAWMNSPDHKANIMNKGYRLLGVGARKSDSGTWYFAQVFGRA
ncbi:CAP domain-containing protein [Nocardioides acrostichi]|uniref:SCP domain-containing protein n=1 Tax=Nocardioides acrostichi TaxID=2784339 RepID=A0A930Y7T7_9ACTN|nr:CAP domain-containing protein [Nocardioides acrostichi]MBF4162336.1 hypothetical protein [Nocardioides acrostichi]